MRFALHLMVNVQLLLSTTCCCDLSKKSVCVLFLEQRRVLDAKAIAATCKCTILHMASTHFFKQMSYAPHRTVTASYSVSRSQ